MKTTARLPFEKIRFDHPFRTHLVVTLDAPHVEWESRRPPVCVIPVIDVSGSMAGPKLDRAKKSVQKLVDHLAPGDFCGVVTFTDHVEVVSPPVQMTQGRKDVLKTAVERLTDQGSTNLAGGMLEGLRLANEFQFPDGMLVRVILFTDGHANVGVATQGTALLPLLEKNLGRASLSAFGYGPDADQELLRDLSTRGKGNYAFVAGPDDAMTAFARELGGLLSTYAQDLRLVIRPLGGHLVTGVVSDVDSEPTGSGVTIRIPDILADETRHVVVSVELAAVASPSGEVPAFEVEGSYAVVGQESQVVRERFSLQAGAERVVAGAEQARPDHALDVVVAQAELVRAQIEAEELARRGQHDLAHQRVFVLFQQFSDRGHPAVADAARQVARSMQDSEAFQGSTAYRSSMRKGMSRRNVVSMEGEADATLKSMGLAQPTEAQESMDRRFKSGEPETPAAPKPRTSRSGTSRSPGPVKPTRARRW
jgi:Ca-activated chloride channel family protein